MEIQMKKMSPELKEQYDIIADKMDIFDNYKLKVVEFVKIHGSEKLTKGMKKTLSAFMYDKCKLWRDQPSVKRRVLKTAKRLLKNKKTKVKHS